MWIYNRPSYDDVIIISVLDGNQSDYSTSGSHLLVPPFAGRMIISLCQVVTRFSVFSYNNRVNIRVIEYCNR
jgi:hypothetical protein